MKTTFIQELLLSVFSGTANDYDMQIRDCIDSGLIQGPHMLCAGRCICMTGGHGWQDGIEADGKVSVEKQLVPFLKKVSI